MILPLELISTLGCTGGDRHNGFHFKVAKSFSRDLPLVGGRDTRNHGKTVLPDQRLQHVLEPSQPDLILMAIADDDTGFLSFANANRRDSSGAEFPDFRCMVRARRRDFCAVGAERRIGQPCGMTDQFSFSLSRM